MRWLIVPLLFIGLQSRTQCKTYRLTSTGDTINCTDMKNQKQGKWKIRIESLRGEPGYEEEGVFKNDKKEGPWRLYSLEGDFIGLENYRWGFKDGICRYYTIAGLEREESWRAINPEKPFDTIDVPDVVDQYKVIRKVVKREGETYKNGVWKYYRPGSLSLIKTENYNMDKLVIPKVEGAAPTEMAKTDSTKKTPEQLKTKEILDFEKKNSGKKAFKVRDGRTG
jgi:hypothetical protein